jgi:RNA polymerase sigma-70 factor, ECF subfamily
MDEFPAELDLKGLLWRAMEGDAAALGDLLGIYRSRLASIARGHIRRRLQAKADASDLVQDALLAAHQHFADFRGSTEAEFWAWLRRILAALIANHARRYLGTKRRDARLERSLSADDDERPARRGPVVVAKVRSPSEQAVDREATVRLARALESLPPHYREVVIYRYREGRSFAEVAAQMGRSVESVEKLWVRALDRLRKVLEAGQ